MAIDSKIRSLIEEFGYIKIDEMMRQALTANAASYYQSKDSIGAEGDFITAPEISQLFGEVIGFWAINQWEKIGKPDNFAIIELGGGQGNLMFNLMRAAKLAPKFNKAIKEIVFLEVNDHFKQKQALLLQNIEQKISWITQIDSLPNKPSIVISNEFFDAIPIKQYTKVRDQWYESVLSCEPHDGKLKFDKIELHKTLAKQLSCEYKNARDGAVIEESPESLRIIRKIANHLVKFSGACLTIDYGYNIAPAMRNKRQFTSTLQAIRKHQYVPIIDSLGTADLSAHVDFYALSNAALQQGIEREKLQISSQHNFLINNGITLRHQSLKTKISKEDKLILAKQLNRLIDSKQMGELFKAIEFISTIKQGH